MILSDNVKFSDMLNCLKYNSIQISNDTIFKLNKWIKVLKNNN